MAETLFQESVLSIPDIVRQLLKLIEPDPERLQLKKTPQRFAKAITELTAGYAMDPKTVVNGAVYPVNSPAGLVLARHINFFSLCEHHLLPFFGKINVGYIPNKKIIGLSKIPRIAQIFSRRLQLQERLTQEIAYSLQEILEPKGIAVLIEARHLCLEMRGAKAQESTLTTSFYLGKFKNSTRVRQEFLSHLTPHS